jgi:hypothetical protein
MIVNIMTLMYIVTGMLNKYSIFSSRLFAVVLYDA